MPTLTSVTAPSAFGAHAALENPNTEDSPTMRTRSTHPPHRDQPDHGLLVYLLNCYDVWSASSTNPSECASQRSDDDRSSAPGSTPASKGDQP